MTQVFRVNCSTGAAGIEAMTPAEEAQRVLDLAAAQARATTQASDESARTAAIARVKTKAAADPDYAALALLVGIRP